MGHTLKKAIKSGPNKNVVIIFNKGLPKLMFNSSAMLELLC